MTRALLVLVFVMFAAPASADVDWARGLVTAEGIGVANRAAPSPASARGPARRLAEEAARKKLAKQVLALPLAGGGTVVAKAKGDADVKAAIERVVAHAIAVEAELETDGSWKVTMGVPIEAVRIALAGARTLGANGDEGAAGIVVVEGVVKPAVGYRVGAIAGAATIFVRDVPAWAKDAPRVKAKGAKAGAIDVAAPGGASDATLFVVVGSK